jgi:hypothetical protein
MKKIVVSLLIIAASGCYSSFESTHSFANTSFSAVPELILPFKLRCDNFPDRQLNDTDLYYGKTKKGEITVLLKNKIKNASPVLYTFNNEGHLIDTLAVFREPCYFVREHASYEPWLEISDDCTISVTDTSYSQSDKLDSVHSTKRNPAYIIFYVPEINRVEYEIENSGKITRLK